MTINEVGALRDTVRHAIMAHIAGWRSVSIEEVDGLAPQKTPVRTS
jgi:hypothetical protein